MILDWSDEKINCVMTKFNQRKNKNKTKNLSF